MRVIKIICCISIAYVLSACNASTPEKTSFGVLSPTSILVMPPNNSSVEVGAPYVYMSTLSRPLAERGYYVFPVAVIDHFFKENGLPTPGEMNAISLDKIKEHIGADAVLYSNIVDWGQKFELFQSVAVIDVQLKLVDVDSGKVLWEKRAVARSQGSSSGSATARIFGAVLDQVLGSMIDETPQLARTANQQAIENDYTGLPKGPYRIKAELEKKP